MPKQHDTDFLLAPQAQSGSAAPIITTKEAATVQWAKTVADLNSYGGLQTFNQLIQVIHLADVVEDQGEWENLFNVLKTLARRMGSVHVMALLAQKPINVVFVRQLLTAIPSSKSKISPEILNAIKKSAPDLLLNLYHLNQDNLQLADMLLNADKFENLSLHSNSLPAELKAGVASIRQARVKLEVEKRLLEEEEAYLLEYKRLLVFRDEAIGKLKKHGEGHGIPSGGTAARVTHLSINAGDSSSDERPQGQDNKFTVEEVVANGAIDEKNRLLREINEFNNLIADIHIKIGGPAVGEWPQKKQQLFSLTEINAKIKRHPETLRAKQKEIAEKVAELRQFFSKNNFSIKPRALDIFLGDLFNVWDQHQDVEAKEKLDWNISYLIQQRNYATLIDQDHIETLLASVQLQDEDLAKEERFKKVWSYLLKDKHTQTQLAAYLKNIFKDTTAKDVTNRRTLAIATIQTYCLNKNEIPESDLMNHPQICEALFRTNPELFARYVESKPTLRGNALREFLKRQHDAITGEHLVELGLKIKSTVNLDWKAYLTSRPKDRDGNYPHQKLRNWMSAAFNDPTRYAASSEKIYSLFTSHPKVAKGLGLLSHTEFTHDWLAAAKSDAKVGRLIATNRGLFRSFQKNAATKQGWKKHPGMQYLDARLTFEKDVLANNKWWHFKSRTKFLTEYLQNLLNKKESLNPSFAYVLVTAYWKDIEAVVTASEALQQLSPIFAAKLERKSLTEFALESGEQQAAEAGEQAQAVQDNVAKLQDPIDAFWLFHLTEEATPQQLLELACKYQSVRRYQQEAGNYVVETKLRNFLLAAEGNDRVFARLVQPEIQSLINVTAIIANSLDTAQTIAAKKDLPAELLTIILASPSSARPALDRVQLLEKLNNSSTRHVVLQNILANNLIDEFVVLLEKIEDGVIKLADTDTTTKNELANKILAGWSSVNEDKKPRLLTIIFNLIATINTEQKLKMAQQEAIVKGVIIENIRIQINTEHHLSALLAFTKDYEILIAEILQSESLIKLLFNHSVDDIKALPAPIRTSVIDYVLNHSANFPEINTWTKLLFIAETLTPVIDKIKEDKTPNGLNHRLVLTKEFREFANVPANQSHVQSLVLNVGECFTQAELNRMFVTSRQTKGYALQEAAVAVCGEYPQQLVKVLNSESGPKLFALLKDAINKHLVASQYATLLTTIRVSQLLDQHKEFGVIFENNTALIAPCFDDVLYDPDEETVAFIVTNLEKTNSAVTTDFESSITDTQLLNMMKFGLLGRFIMTRPLLCHRLAGLGFEFTDQHKELVLNEIIKGNHAYLTQPDFVAVLACYIAENWLKDATSINAKLNEISKLFVHTPFRTLLLNNLSVQALEILFVSRNEAVEQVFFASDEFKASEMFSIANAAIQKVDLMLPKNRDLLVLVLRDPSYSPGPDIDKNKLMAILADDKPAEAALRKLIWKRLTDLGLVFPADRSQCRALAKQILVTATQSVIQVIFDNQQAFDLIQVLSDVTLCNELSLKNSYFLRALLQADSIRERINFIGEQLIELAFSPDYKDIFDNPSFEFKEFIGQTVKALSKNPSVGKLIEVLKELGLDEPPSSARSPAPVTAVLAPKPVLPEKKYTVEGQPKSFNDYMRIASDAEFANDFKLAIEYYFRAFQLGRTLSNVTTQGLINAAEKLIRLGATHDISMLIHVIATTPTAVAEEQEYVGAIVHYFMDAIPQLADFSAPVLREIFSNKDRFTRFTSQIPFIPQGKDFNTDRQNWVTAIRNLLLHTYSELRLEILTQRHVMEWFCGDENNKNALREWVLGVMKSDNTHAENIFKYGELCALLTDEDILEYVGKDKTRARWCFHYGALHDQLSGDTLVNIAVTAGYGGTVEEAGRILLNSSFIYKNLSAEAIEKIKDSLAEKNPTTNESAPQAPTPTRPRQKTPPPVVSFDKDEQHQSNGRRHSISVGVSTQAGSPSLLSPPRKPEREKVQLVVNNLRELEKFIKPECVGNVFTALKELVKPVSTLQDYEACIESFKSTVEGAIDSVKLNRQNITAKIEGTIALIREAYPAPSSAECRI